MLALTWPADRGYLRTGMTRPIRGNLLVLGAALLMAVTPVLGTAGCSGPYAGKAERLKHPRKKKRPPPPPPSKVVIQYDDECRVKFNEDNSRVRRRQGEARALIGRGDTAMSTAVRTPDPKGRTSLIIDAINKYKNALSQDPYSATATYHLAVAYALVRKKGCTIALLKRLTELQKHPDFEAEATRMIKSVDNEPAFKGFQKDALTAAGQ